MNIGVNARLILSHKMEGISRYIFETTNRMAVKHPNNTFYLFFDRNIQLELNFSANVHKIVIPLHARHPILWHIWFEYLLPYYLKKYKIDVFYSGDTYMSLSTKTPTLLVSHDLAYLHYPDHIPKFALAHYRYFFPKYHQKSHHIIAVSLATKLDIQQNYNIPSSKITVAYNAVSDLNIDINTLSKEHIMKEYAENCPYFCYLGSLHPRKNIINLMEAFTLFKSQYETNHKLLLLGRMAWKSEKIKALLDKNKDIIHVGMVDDATKNKILFASSALVYISLFEGFGIPLIESMALGVPVITSNVSSMPEVAKDAALIVDPNNINEIAESMFEIIQNHNLRDSLIQKGKLRANDFNWDNSAEIIYKKLVEISKS